MPKIIISWSAMARRYAGIDLPDFERALIREAIDLMEEAEGYFLQVLNAKNNETIFICEVEKHDDRWCAFVKLGHYVVDQYGGVDGKILLPRAFKSDSNVRTSCE